MLHENDTVEFEIDANGRVVRERHYNPLKKYYYNRVNELEKIETYLEGEDDPRYLISLSYDGGQLRRINQYNGQNLTDIYFFRIEGSWIPRHTFSKVIGILRNIGTLSLNDSLPNNSPAHI